MKIGTNTFGLGSAFMSDLTGALESLKESGITSIEPCILFHEDRLEGKTAELVAKKVPAFGGIFPSSIGSSMIREFRNAGFKVCSIHIMGIDWAKDSIDDVLGFCRENEIRYAVFSPMESYVEKINEILPAFRAAAISFRSEDRWFLIHNHAAEWKDNCGTNVMTFLSEQLPELGFELDAGWAEYAGVSSVEFMKKYPEKIRLLHLKEIQKEGIPDSSKPFCVAPGTGILPLADVMAEAKNLPLDEEGILLDQDNSVKGDVLADIREGVSNILKV